MFLVIEYSSNVKRQNMGVRMTYPTNRSNRIVSAATQVENSPGTLRYTSYEANAWRLEVGLFFMILKDTHYVFIESDTWHERRTPCSRCWLFHLRIY